MYCTIKQYKYCLTLLRSTSKCMLVIPIMISAETGRYKNVSEMDLFCLFTVAVKY